MLFRQDFGGRHERDVVAALQRHQRAARRNDRFAGAHVALQQPPHWVRARHVPAQLAQDFSLRSGQLEAEPGKKGLDQVVVPAARQRSGLGLEMPPAMLYSLLQFDEFVQSEPPHCQFGISVRFREMQHPNRPGAGGKGSGRGQGASGRSRVLWKLRLATC